MADIDLIPASWRAEQRARRTLRGGLVAVGCAIAAVAAARVGIGIANRQATTALQTLQAQRRDSDRIAARLTTLNARVDEARELSRKVAALRGPDVVSGVLVPIDAALGESIWFDELIFTRIPALPQPGTPIAPADASLAIRGKAPDPATIGAFAGALGNSGPCAKPRLVPGNVKQYNRFELASICSSNSIVTEYSTTAAKCTLTVSILDGAIVKAPLCYSSCEGIDLSNPNIKTSIINLNVTG